MSAMEFTGYLHSIYTNLPRERVIALTQALFQQRYGFRWESNDWQGEDWLLFHRDQAMMDHHLDHGYNEDMGGQGCVGFEGKTADWLGVAHAMEVNGTKADPDVIDWVAHMCLKGIYHITLVLPGDIGFGCGTLRLPRGESSAGSMQPLSHDFVCLWLHTA